MTKIEKLILLNASSGRVFEFFGNERGITCWVPGIEKASLIQGHRSLWTLDIEEESRRNVVVEIAERRAPEYIRWRVLRENESVNIEAEFTETRAEETLLRVLFDGETQPASATSHGSLLLDLLASPDKIEAERKLEISLAEFKDAAPFAEDTQTQESVKPQAPADDAPTDDAPTDEFAARVVSNRKSEDDEVAPNESNQNFESASGTLIAPDFETTLIRQPAITNRNQTSQNSAKPETDFDDARRHNESANRVIPTARNHTPPRTRTGFPMMSVLLISLAFLCALALVWIWLSSRAQPVANNGDPIAVSSANNENRNSTSSRTSNVAPAPQSGNTSSNLATSAPVSEVQPATPVRERAPTISGANPQTLDAAKIELQQHLTDWIDATNAADLAGQMKFYAPIVERYYLRRNFSRAAVERDKESLMARTRLTDVTVEDVKTDFSSGNQVATMRFRKSYGFEGRSRRNAVLQELTWRKTSNGWRITGERDLQVLS